MPLAAPRTESLAQQEVVRAATGGSEVPLPRLQGWLPHPPARPGDLPRASGGLLCDGVPSRPARTCRLKAPPVAPCPIVTAKQWSLVLVLLSTPGKSQPCRDKFLPPRGGATNMPGHSGQGSSIFPSLPGPT